MKTIQKLAFFCALALLGFQCQNKQGKVEPHPQKREGKSTTYLDELLQSLPANARARGAVSVVERGNAAFLFKYQEGAFTAYIQAVNLKEAKLDFVYQGGPASPNNLAPHFERRSVRQWWNYYAPTHPKVFCVTNGAFFDFRLPRIPFPIKHNGVIVNAGLGNGESFAKLKLGINGSEAFIYPYENTQNNYGLVAANLLSPDVIVGLHPEANKGKYFPTGRTFIGIRDIDGDAKNEWLFIACSAKAKQAEMDELLRNVFASNKTIMFDGSGSSQLYCKGTTYVPGDGRRFRHAFAVLDE